MIIQRQNKTCCVRGKNILTKISVYLKHMIKEGYISNRLNWFHFTIVFWFWTWTV